MKNSTMQDGIATQVARHQVKELSKRYAHNKRIEVEVRFDDRCGNGHNTFGITASTYIGKQEDMGGCLHELVAEQFPELAPYIKWHLMSTDGPLHYIANTTYHARNGNLGYARSTAVWPEATLEQLQDEDTLKARLSQLLADFRQDMETLGFAW